ncbi:MAG: hypothetical protein B9S32_08255 [Verrucomicrobia bacterium Tous-C9LFEB]|nr:MAG: hypothetical protein B9S32_08255 [Verrucomicrobia bacterium Tous-C9LFEB]
MSQAKTIALIGVSSYARMILRCLRRAITSGDYKLAAVVVINPVEEAETCRELEATGCRIYGDYRTMLREWSGRLDLCIVPTSIHWHKPMTLDALAAGANVLVEKPLAGSVAEGRAILDAAHAAGKFVAVGFQDMYGPVVWELKDWLLSGQAGPIESVHVTGSWPRHHDYYTRNDWAGRLQCGGRPVYDSPLNNAFAHFVNLALFLSGSERHEAAEIQNVSGNLWRFYPIETFDTARVCCRSREGVPIHIALTHVDVESVAPRIVVRLRDGEVAWTHDQDAVFRGLEGQVLHRWAIPTGEVKQETMLREVLSSLTTGLAPRCPAALAMRHLEVIAQLHAQLPIREGAETFPELEALRSGPWESIPGLLPRLEESPSMAVAAISHK